MMPRQFPSLPLDSLLALATSGTQEGEGLGVGAVSPPPSDSLSLNLIGALATCGTQTYHSPRLIGGLYNNVRAHVCAGMNSPARLARNT